MTNKKKLKALSAMAHFGMSYSASLESSSSCYHWLYVYQWQQYRSAVYSNELAIRILIGR